MVIQINIKQLERLKVSFLFFFSFEILHIGEFMVSELYLVKITKLEFLEVKIVNREKRTFFFLKTNL